MTLRKGSELRNVSPNLRKVLILCSETALKARSRSLTFDAGKFGAGITRIKQLTGRAFDEERVVDHLLKVIEHELEAGSRRGDLSDDFLDLIVIVQDVGGLQDDVYLWMRNGMLAPVGLNIEHYVEQRLLRGSLDEGSDVIFATTIEKYGSLLHREAVVTFRFIAALNADVATLKKIDSIELAMSEKFFRSTGTNDFYGSDTSIADVLVRFRDGHTETYEVKAWFKSTLKFRADGLTLNLSQRQTRPFAGQCHRYLFEAVFLRGNIKTLHYVIPADAPEGINRDMVKRGVEAVFRMSPADVDNALGPGARSLDVNAPPTGVEVPDQRRRLAHALFESIRADPSPDFSFDALIQRWNDLLRADALLANPRLYPGLPISPAADSALLDATALSSLLTAHLDDASALGGGVVVAAKR